MTGDLIDLAAARAERRVEQVAASEHPSLRWVAGAAFYTAHRRGDDGPSAACGARGDLTLAPPGVPLCVKCFPPTATGT